MSKAMKIAEAKKYVADKVGLSVAEIHDPVIMREIREDYRIGVIQSLPGLPKGMEAKHHIARLLDIEINSLNLFNRRCREDYRE